MRNNQTETDGDAIASFAPAFFVLIWSTGFVTARLVAPYAEPLSFLMLRYALAVAILAALALRAGAAWPTSAREWRDGLVAGVLIHGLYLGGVFWAVRNGLSAGISALIVGLQPLATALLVGWLLGESVSARRWLGVATGFAGAALVIAPSIGEGAGAPPLQVAICLVAMLSITLGTIWQKRTGGTQDPRSNTVVHFIGAALVTAPAALLLETGRIEFNGPVLIGLLWSVFGISIGGIFLLLALIRRGAVAGVAALLYLVPPVSALMAWAMFGETLTLVQMGGMALAALGVAIAASRKA